MNCTDSVNFTIPSENSDVADKDKWGKGGVSLLFKVNHLFECWFTLFSEKLKIVLQNKKCGKLPQFYFVFWQKISI